MIKNIHKELKTRNWNTIAGKIILSKIVENNNFETVEGHITTAFSYDIQYEYEIDEKKYYGNKINLMKIETTDKKYINKILEKYKN
jgi:RNA binding exosome subunit